jgi:hypothetical protein
MSTMLVVPAGNKFEDGQLGMGSRRPDVAVNQLSLERGEEALGHRIVPARTRPTDALASVVGCQ